MKSAKTIRTTPTAARALRANLKRKVRLITPCHMNTAAPAAETAANTYASGLIEAKYAMW